MSSLGVREAKQRFHELVRRAEAGEYVVITRNGVPIARLERLASKTSYRKAARRRVHRGRQG